jgi:hypothetical protein
MRAGVHVVAQKPLVEYLRFKPKREIIRMPQVGFFEVDGHYICVRSNETLLPPAKISSTRPIMRAILTNMAIKSRARRRIGRGR